MGYPSFFHFFNVFNGTLGFKFPTKISVPLKRLAKDIKFAGILPLN